ncbi:hypothetical protein HDU99_008489, partial [Rhizoclosmatium hyalinum]
SGSMKLKKSMSLKKMAAGVHAGMTLAGSFRTSLGTAGSVDGSQSIHDRKKIEELDVTNAEELAAIGREQVERDMKFLGFVLLKNPLKAEMYFEL